MTRHRLNPGRLRAEIVKRGLDGQSFARHSGISAATLSHVVNGRSANPRTFAAIVRTLGRLPVVEGMEDLLEEIAAGDEGLRPSASPAVARQARVEQSADPVSLPRLVPQRPRQGAGGASPDGLAPQGSRSMRARAS